MKKLLYVLTGLCLLAGVFAGCEKKPLDDSDNPNGGGTGGGSITKGTIEGIVTVKGTEKPVMLASVMLLPTEKLTLTDTAGSFSFRDIEQGTYKLQVKRIGYTTYTSEEIKVEGGKTVRYDVALESVKSELQILDTNGTVITELNVGHSPQGIFILKNAGEEIVEWEIPKLAVDWISGFSKQSGKLAPDASDTVVLSVDRSKLSEDGNEAILYIGTSGGDKKLLIKAGVQRSFCFTDESGEEIIEVELSDANQYRFKIKNTGSDVLTWKVSNIEANWLTFVGKTDGKLEIGESESRTLKVDRTRFEEGTYETELVFSTNAGERKLPVKVKVEMSFRLENTDGTEISEIEFGSATSKKFRIRNTGNGVLKWEVSSTEADWLTLGDKKGSLQPGTTEIIGMTIDRTKLSVGDNRVMVTVSTNAGDKQLEVNAQGELSYILVNEQGMEISSLDLGKTSQGSFKIKNTGDGILEWEVSPADAIWLALGNKRNGSLQSGATASIVVNVDRMLLSVGDNQTTLNLSTNAGDKQLQINARLDMPYQLVNAQGGEIDLLDLDRSTSGLFKIKNMCDGILEWEVNQEDADWLSLNVTQGKLNPNAVTTIELTIDKSRLTQGNNETMLSIHTNITGGDKQLQIKAYRLQPSDVMPEMVYVAGGTFEMGSDKAQEFGPVYNVLLSSFYIGKYEITQQQWEVVMGTTLEEQQAKSESSYNIDIVGKGDTYPMYFVSWEDAVAFCERLSELTGETYRLPTEAEWEYAARGGRHKDGTMYAGSDNLGSVAWYKNNSGEKTHPVGQKRSNGLGLYDMSGNVMELCYDWRWYSNDFPYDSDPVVNPQGPSSGTRRCCRGGSWEHETKAWTHHVSYRYSAHPQYRANILGFRVVREP